MKKILFATLVALSIPLVSCTSEAVETNTNSSNLTNNQNEMVLNQKPGDSIGGQGGQTPPPRP